MMIQSARIIFLHTGSESLNTCTVNKSRHTYELINIKHKNASISLVGRREAVFFMVQLMANYNYQACVAFVRKQEGGNTDTRGDRGGRTGRGGITHTTYDSYRDKKGLPRQDVFLINDAEIAEIYWNGYWQPIRGDELPAGVDLSIFDFAINSGTAKANCWI
jgi:Glycosyl hydrolase 108